MTLRKMPPLTEVAKSLLFPAFLVALFFAAIVATDKLVGCQPKTTVETEK